MKKFINRLISLSTAMAMGLSLAGCSGISSKKPTIQLSVWGSEQDQESLMVMADSFAKKYENEANIEITVCEESEGTCKDTVLLCPEVAADVYFFADDQLSMLVEAGALDKVEGDAKAQVVEDVGGEESVAIDAASIENALYAYPCTASNGYFLYYNSNYISEEQAGDLDTILDIAEANGKKFGMEMTSGWYMYSFYTGAGLDVHISDDGSTNVCDWNDTDKEVTGAQVTQTLIDIAARDGFANVDNNAFVEGVKDGTIIAGISGTWNATDVEQAYGDGYAASKLPCYTVAGKRVQMHSVAGYKLAGVNAYSANKEWAHRFAQWVTNEENQLLRFESRGEGPANVKAANNEKVQQSVAIAALADQIQYGHIQYVEGSYWDATYKLGNIIVAGNIEKKNVQVLMDEFVKSITGGVSNGF